MTYYIIGKNEDTKNLVYSSNIIGEESFGSFYVEDGFTALHNIINNSPDMIDEFIIMDEAGKKYEVEELLSMIGKCKIIAKST